MAEQDRSSYKPEKGLRFAEKSEIKKYAGKCKESENDKTSACCFKKLKPSVTVAR